MKPYFEQDGITIYHGDCRDVLPAIAGYDLALVDPPYGETSLTWDKWVDGWPDLLMCNSMWCFGSLRCLAENWPAFKAWHLSQDVVWKKQNGTNFHNDRFRRVHEHILHFYRGQWSGVWKSVQKTMDATARTVRRNERPPHTGDIADSTFVAHDGGPRMMTSILEAKNCHGYAVHPTQKPVAILGILIEYSCPAGGLVVDPFMGSGSTLLAARDLGRQVIGIETDEGYCESAANRLNQGVLEFT